MGIGHCNRIAHVVELEDLTTKWGYRARAGRKQGWGGCQVALVNNQWKYMHQPNFRSYQ